MYNGDNGTRCVYVSCITSDMCMSSKMFLKGLNWSIRAIVSKWGILSLHREKGRPLRHDARVLENHATTLIPLVVCGSMKSNRDQLTQNRNNGNHTILT